MNSRRSLVAPVHGVHLLRTACAVVFLVASLLLRPLTVRAAGPPPSVASPSAETLVPRALRHADSDGNHIFDDLETRLEQSDPAQAVPVLILFDQPLGQVDLNALEQKAGDFRIDLRFPREAAIRALLTPAQVRSLAPLPHVLHIEGDDLIAAARATAVPTFGVTKARDDYGLSGDGDGDPDHYSPADHTIAVIDTGIDGEHADFAGGKIIGWVDLVNGRPTPYDDEGHGTHVASIAAGQIRNGVGGVAPGAALVGVKALDTEGLARTSLVVEGIDWCLDHQRGLGIRVINLSVSGSGSGDGTDLISQAIHTAVSAGIVVCVAAGNDGPSSYTIPTPGAAPDAITVGTMIDPGKGGFALWTTSGRGPTLDGRIKPDLVAPGYQIMAAKAGTVTDSIPLTGSSMATPFVAGVAALMLEANPSLQPADIKAILRRTAVDFGPPGEDVDYGAGRLDAYAAIREADAPSHRLDLAGPPVPSHLFLSGSLAPNGHDAWPIEVGDTQHAIAVVLIAADWNPAQPTLFQLRLRDPDGHILATAASDQRSLLIHFQPPRPGIYTLLVDPLAGQGSYLLDASYDGAATVQSGQGH